MKENISTKDVGSAGKPKQTINADVRRNMIEEAAYLRASERGFSGGDPLNDWLTAEKWIDARLRKQNR
ncbi:MAG: DUF2934 domain-containing protein [Acidiferrobacterales bacterium]